MRHVIVVGAGTAGCIVASRLTENPETSVLLIEDGPDHDHENPALSSHDFFEVLGESARVYPDLLASKIENGPPSRYLRGRGIGGSAAVNAMLALPGLPADYDRWSHHFGCSDWSWSHVWPWFEKLKNDLTVSGPNDANPMSLALLGAAADLGLANNVDTYDPTDGGGFLWRNANTSGRFSSYERYLLPARDRGNLSIRSNCHIDSILFKNDAAIGVRIDTGEEIAADEVIVCAGVFESPALLLRSGLPHPGIGKNLQDHPAARIYLSLKEDFQQQNPRRPAIESVLRLSSSVGQGDIHLLTTQGSLLPEASGIHGSIMAALMKVTSVGELSLNPDDPNGRPVIQERMLCTHDDRRAMTEAVQDMLRVLDTPSFARAIENAYIDSVGTPVSALRGKRDIQAWLAASVGDYFHACGTVRMGRVNDPSSVVNQAGQVHGYQGLHVIDASIMPDVPRANTHLPTVMIAERLSANINATWNSDCHTALATGQHSYSSRQQ